MRNLYKSIQHVELAVARGLDRKPERPAAPSPSKPKSSIRGWRAPASNTVYLEQMFRGSTGSNRIQIEDKDKPMATKLTVTARALKVTAILDTATVAALPVSDGQSRSQLAVAVDGKLYSADIATKSLRKCKSTIATNGAENTFVMIQGKLKGNEITECGLVAQVKSTQREKGNG
jgi:hypothetical protein